MPESTIHPAPDSLVPLLAQNVSGFLAAVAAKSPAPGGGSVTALTGALAAALAQMALQYTLGKPRFKNHEVELAGAMAQLAKAQAALQELVEEDKAAYETLSELLRLSGQARQASAHFKDAVLTAIAIPESVGAFALAVLDLCGQLPTKINPLLVSDLGIAAELALATVRASELNVLVNLPLLNSPDEAARHREEVRSQTAKAAVIAQEIRGKIRTILDPTKA